MTSRALVVSYSPLPAPTLETLRAGYSSDALRALGKTFLTEPYPAMLPWASFVMDELYAGQPLAPLQRELVLTGLLVSHKQPGTIAVHLYWALMEGATPDMLAHTILLTGTYAGIDAYTVGIRTLNALFQTLDALAAEGHTDTASVMRAVVQLFPA